jgi:glycine reductase
VTLELGNIAVRHVEFGPSTRVRDGRLIVDHDSLRRALVDAIPALETVAVDIVRPGEAARVVCVKDLVEPRLKIEGERPGEGRTRALKGVAVATCGQIVGFQEGLIDMSGPGAAYSSFSELNLVVLDATVRPGTAPHEHEAALREAGLRAAAMLGAAAADAAPDNVEIFDGATPSAAGLPRVAYVYMLLSQGLLHDTYVLGRNASEGLPRIVEPAMPLDSGIVSGNCVSACDKNTTYHHQNNPVLLELLRCHGRDLDLAAVVLTNIPMRLGEKQQSARRAVELVAGRDVDVTLVTTEGFGNPDADLMLITRGLRQEGIPAVALTDEFAGADGASESLADAVAEADALVSVGNANELIALPPMERVVGPLDLVPRLAGAHAGSLRADSGIEVELQTIMGATNQLGMTRLSCREI